MKKSKVQKLEHGLYKIYWKSGETSLGSVGSTEDGSRWMAPINWVSGSTSDRKSWKMVDKMKKLFLILLFTNFISSAQTKPPYQHWDFSHGCFIATFTNNTSFQVVGVGTSDAPFGTFTLCCVQHYLEFIKKLYDYGGMTAHLPIRGFTRIDDTDIPGITITLQNSHPYILIVDADGAVWKLTKAEAFALVPILQQQSNVIQMTTCPDPNCICTQNR